MEHAAACEVWIESKHKGYFFSSLGRAGRRLANGSMRILIGCACGAGYRAISVPNGSGRYLRIYIHRGVCEAFHGPCPEGMECRHLNGDKTDNRADNVRWGTAAENSQDKVLHGTVSKGERNGGAKLTSEQVRQMRQLRLHSGLTFRELACQFGVSTMTAYRASVGQSWN